MFACLQKVCKDRKIEKIKGKKDGKKNGRKDGSRKKGWKKGWMDEWINGRLLCCDEG